MSSILSCLLCNQTNNATTGNYFIFAYLTLHYVICLEYSFNKVYYDKGSKMTVDS